MPSTARGPFLNSRTRPSTSMPALTPCDMERNPTPLARAIAGATHLEIRVRIRQHDGRLVRPVMRPPAPAYVFLTPPRPQLSLRTRERGATVVGAGSFGTAVA